MPDCGQQTGDGGGAMTFNAGLRGESRATRAVGAACSVAVVALIAGCDLGSTQVRLENNCDVPIQATFTNLVEKLSKDAEPRWLAEWEVDVDAALDIAAGASSTLTLGSPSSGNSRSGGAAFVTIRGGGGEWINVAPMGEEAPPGGSDVGYIKDGVLVIDGALCAQLDG